MGMFDFLTMIDDFDKRKVERLEAKDCDGNDYILDTAQVNDCPKYPYETAFAHPSYNDGKWVIVQQYKNKESARIGHFAWADIFSSKELPDSLIQCNAGEFAEMFLGVEGEIIKRKK
jgi:hypothetical protein